MSQSATLAWFARHEFRLFWRDWISMMTAGKRSRESVLAVVAVVVALLSHLLAYAIIAPFAEAGIWPDKTTLVTVTGSAILSWMLMLSQAMESVTRAFYARASLDLILSLPASARRLFAVRMTGIGLATTRCGRQGAVSRPQTWKRAPRRSAPSRNDRCQRSHRHKGLNVRLWL